MAKTIKIPGVGTVPAKYAIAGAGVVLLIVGVAYWRHRNAPAATEETPPADGSYTDPTSGSTYPTGYQGEQYYPSGGTPYSPYGYDIYGNPLPAPTGASGTGGVYSNNNEWATAAEASLEQAGVTIAVSAAAISKVLGGLTVTPAQRDVFLQAVGLLGQPPQGYPQPIKLSSTPSSGPSTPVVPGKPANLHRGTVTKTSVEIAWNQVPGAAGYRIFAQGATGRQTIGTNTGISATRFTHRGLKAGTRHRYWVAAFNSAGQGPTTGSFDVTTARK